MCCVLWLSSRVSEGCMVFVKTTKYTHLADAIAVCHNLDALYLFFSTWLRCTPTPTIHTYTWRGLDRMQPNRKFNNAERLDKDTCNDIFKLTFQCSTSGMHTHMHSHTYALTHICTHTHMHSHTYALTHICTHTHMHSHTWHTHMHTNTHAHTHTC